MSIYLENFRCHVDGKYKIPSSGLVMVTGNSGKGKSSLLNAIVYALYGSKAIRRPYTHGTKSCKVTLKMNGMIITRTSTPNRLLLNYDDKDYEDAAAQGVIEEIMGMNYNEFIASSYVIQRKHNSVLSMSPLEQVKFVETLAFSNNKHIEYKERIKKHVQDCKERKTWLEGQKSLLEKQFEDAKQRLPEKKVSSKINGKNLEDISKELKNVQKSFEEASDEITELQKELENKRNFERKQKIIQDKISDIETQIKSYKEMKTDLDSKDIEKKKKECLRLKTLLSQTRSYDSYYELNEKVKGMEKSHCERLKKELEKLKKECPTKKQITNLEKQRVCLQKEQKEFMKLSSQAEEIKTKKKKALEEVKKIKKETKAKVRSSTALLDFLIQKEDELSKLNRKLYKCPSCSTNLEFQEDKLCICEEPSKSGDNLEDISKELDQIRIHLKTIQEYKPFLDEKVPVVKEFDSSKLSEIEKKLYSVEEKQKIIDELSNDIQNNKLPPEIQDLLRDVENKKKDFPKTFKPSIGLEELEKKLEKCSSELNDLIRRSSENIRLEKEIKTRENKLKILKEQIDKSKVKRRNCLDIEKEINNLQTKTVKYNKTLNELQETYQILSKLEQYNRDLKNMEKLKQKLEDTKDDLTQSIDNLSGALGLRESVKEAEILSLEHTVNSINEHAKIYLQEMFDDNINIYLDNQKLTKTQNVKTQMNVYLEYKGYTYNSIDELSGGEKQRCELAFLLAVNDMLGSKIILLDECLNNLDSEVNMEVLLHLKRLVGNRLVLVISHEAVQGIFDHVIKV